MKKTKQNTLLDLLMLLFRDQWQSRNLAEDPESDSNQYDNEVTVIKYLNRSLKTRKRLSKANSQPPVATRIYSPEECAKLSVSARGLLHKLEAQGYLSRIDHETLIEDALALDEEYIDTEILSKLLSRLLSSEQKAQLKLPEFQSDRQSTVTYQ